MQTASLLRRPCTLLTPFSAVLCPWHLPRLMYLLAMSSLTLLHGSPGNPPILVSKLQEHLAAWTIALTLFLPAQFEYNFPSFQSKASVNHFAHLFQTYFAFIPALLVLDTELKCHEIEKSESVPTTVYMDFLVCNCLTI